MPIDPSLSLKVQAPQYESPINMMSQIAQLRASQQQEAFNALRLAEAQRQQEEQSRLNALLAGGNVTPTDLVQTAPGRAIMKSIGEAFHSQQAGMKEHRLAEAEQLKTKLKQRDAIVEALRPLAAVPEGQMTKDLVAAQLTPLVQFGIPQQLIDQSISQIPDNPTEIKRDINFMLSRSMTGQQQAELTAPKPQAFVINGKQVLIDMNPNSPTFRQLIMVTPEAPYTLPPGGVRMQGDQVIAQAPFAPREGAAAPAPTVTEIVDPNDPTRMIKIDARTGQTLGVSGKTPEAAKAAAKTEEKQAKEDVAQDQLVGLLDNLRASYARLDQLKAIPSTERGVIRNLQASAGASAGGQLVGRAAGTEAQKERDFISNTRNLLLTSVKNATGLSAQQLNSNVEFVSWRNSLTDPAQSIQTVEKTIDQLENFIRVAKTKPKGMMPKREEYMSPQGAPTRGQTPVESSGGLSPAEEAELRQLRQRFGKSQ